MTTVGSLASGFGGLDHAVMAHFDAELAWVSEVDPDACKVLAHHYPDVPNLGDLRVVEWESVPWVDVICAGPPCQPTSSAGLRKGEDDERWLWPATLDAVRRVRPRWVVFENPSALLSLHGGEPFGRILGALAEMGYLGRYGTVRASDVGACHRRERVWIVATDARGTGAGRDTGAALVAEEPARRSKPGDADAPVAGGATVADADQPRLQRRSGHDVASREGQVAAHVGSLLPTPRTSDANGGGQHGDGGPDLRTVVAGCTGWGNYEAAIRRHESVIGRPAPSPVDERGRLSAVFCEWMMCLEEGWVTDVPGVSRSAQLRILGNGVVAPAAAAALRMLTT